jgi:hypothetical protein
MWANAQFVARPSVIKGQYQVGSHQFASLNHICETQHDKRARVDFVKLSRFSRNPSRPVISGAGRSLPKPCSTRFLYGGACLMHPLPCLVTEITQL